MGKLTWMGDEDPSRQSVEMFGLHFVKGEAVDVPKDHPKLKVLENNPAFSADAKAEVVESIEPEPVDPEAGTELAAAKHEAQGLGIKLQGNPALATVRSKIAEHHAKADKA